MINLLTKIKPIAIISIFAMYWGVTFFFVVLPSDGAAILLNYSAYKKFDTLFFQRWGFFAPPPNFDERLYFTFENKENSSDIKTIEVVEKLHENSIKKYPFNDDEIALDYIIHNTAESISGVMRDSYEVYQLDNCADTNDNQCSDKFILDLKNKHVDNVAGNTLVNYGRLIAENIGITDNYYLRITYKTISMPKFSKRNDKDFVGEESTKFSTNNYDLNQNKWMDY